MKTLSTFVKATALAAVLFAAPAAFASEKVDTALKDKVTAHLTAQGYDVRKIQMEDGRIEVYAVKDGQAMEFYLDGQLNIVKGKGEDSEGSEDSEG
jgi:peptidase YpeB-like protein